MHMTLLEAALGAAAVIAIPIAAIGLVAGPADRSAVPVVEIVRIDGAAIDFPLPGEFLGDGNPVAIPVERRDVPAFRIMKRQVSLADYRLCVRDGACAAPDAKAADADVPVTGVNWLDAQAFATWYSRATGETWRLPTALEAAARRPPDPEPRPRGHYGPNSLGIEDFGGNVWEWTSTCYARVTLGDDRTQIVHSIGNCGVRVMEGRHRTYMSTFVRDGKSGGCAVGTPPENLSFRLVLEEGRFPQIARLLAALQAPRS